MKKSELRQIIKEEYKKVLNESRADAADIVKLLNKEKGEDFKANWTGATDRFNVSDSKVVTINRGKGFEKAVLVNGNGGTFFYFGPFSIDNMPTKDSMLMFKCDDAFFVKGI